MSYRVILSDPDAPSKRFPCAQRDTEEEANEAAADFRAEYPSYRFDVEPVDGSPRSEGDTEMRGM